MTPIAFTWVATVIGYMIVFSQNPVTVNTGGGGHDGIVAIGNPVSGARHERRSPVIVMEGEETTEGCLPA
jgi:hypothetical protein